MANQNRRITKIIKGAVKNLKRGEIPFPPPPKTMSASEEQQLWTEMETRRREIQAHLKRLTNDSSRAGYKRLLQFQEEIDRLEELLKSRS